MGDDPLLVEALFLIAGADACALVRWMDENLRGAHAARAPGRFQAITTDVQGRRSAIANGQDTRL